MEAMMRSLNSPRLPSRTRLASALAVAMLALPAAPAMAQSTSVGELPRAGSVVGGNATISYNPGQFDNVGQTATSTITQSTRGAIIEWGSFSIGRQSDAVFNAVTFQHLIAGAVTLNRVVGFGNGPALSTIAGALNAPNGSVFLVNPAGVTFASGSVTNVGGLVASTLAISDDDFLKGVDSGHYVFGGTGDETLEMAYMAPGAIVRTTAAGGTVALLGGVVDAEGTVIADGGTIGLVAARQVTLDPFGDGLTQFTVNVSNGGDIYASGVLQAQTVDTRAGRIVLSTGDAGTVNIGVGEGIVSSSLDVRGNATNESGGELLIDTGQIAIGGRADADTSCAAPDGACAILDASGQAGGGSIALTARSGISLFGDAPASSNGSAVQLRADALGTGNGGRITLQNGTTGAGEPTDVTLLGSVLLSANAATADGGTLSIVNTRGGLGLATDVVESYRGDIVLQADAARDGGAIALSASDQLTTSGDVSLLANGGRNGGQVRTLGFDVDLRNVDVRAGGTDVTGRWQINSTNDLTIVAGTDESEGNSMVSDTSIANALTSGTDVSIAAQDPEQPRQINLAPGAEILTKNAIATTLTLSTPGGQIVAGEDAGTESQPWQIASTSAALNVAFDARSSISLYHGSIASDGGQIRLTSAGGDGYGIDVLDSTLDSAGGNVLVDGGIADGVAVSLEGSAMTTHGGQLTVRGTSVGDAGVEINDSVLDTRRTDGSGGALAIIGVSQNDEGVSLIDSAVNAASTQITGTSTDGVGVNVIDTTLDPGALQMRGTGSIGVLLAAATINTGASTADISGIGTTDGVVLTKGASIDSTSGDIVIGGISSGDGNGIRVEGGNRIASGDANLMLRASSAAGTALAVAGTVDSARLVNLRTGRDDGTGNVVDDTAAAMVLGGNFTSIASLGRITTPDLVVGHAGHAGAITLAANLARTTHLTLQNDGGTGGIALNGAVSTGDGTLVLSSGGDIAQAATGGITAHSLLVRAGGNVNLAAGQNQLSGDTLAGSAGGNFNYVDAGPLSIGAVSGSGVLASGAGNVIALNGIAAGGDVLVRNNGGNLTLRAGVSGRNVDLITAGTLQNVGDARVTATGTWRVWSSTWLGEDRGGLLGSGTRPNLFNCSYGGACGVTIGGDNHFVYTAQPTLTLNIADATRQYGDANPAFGLTATGLVFADDRLAAAAAGTPTSDAGIGSNVGSYAIDGAFVSDVGYALQVDPGVLSVTPATLTYAADPRSILLGQPLGTMSGTVTGFRNGDTLGSATTGTLLFSTDGGVIAPGSYGIFGSGLQAGNYVFVQAPSNLTALQVNFTPTAALPDIVRLPPDNYLYDLNLGMAPICPAETPAGMRREQDGDTLGREWARVRSRPNLSSCVSSERENGCGDF